MQRFVHVFITLLLIVITGSSVSAMEVLRLATTTSTDNSGLLAEILPPFEKENHCRVDVISVGTGKAIKLGETGDVDVILVHARSKEDDFVAGGFGIDRRDVMYNDFILVGPPTDPARVRDMKDVAKAMARIAETESAFFSRGDESGTHLKEQRLWQDAGIKPSGSWYHETGRGMGEVLIMTGERQGYTLSDRGTFLAFKFKNQVLDILVAGDPRLFNPYGVIMVNPDRHPHVNALLALRFLDYMTSEPTRRRIKNYRVNGEQLFYVAE